MFAIQFFPLTHSKVFHLQTNHDEEILQDNNFVSFIKVNVVL